MWKKLHISWYTYIINFCQLLVTKLKISSTKSVKISFFCQVTYKIDGKKGFSMAKISNILYLLLSYESVIFSKAYSLCCYVAFSTLHIP